MVLTHSKHKDRPVASNGTRLLKPTIGLTTGRKKIDKGKYDKKSNAVLTLVMTIALPARSPWPILGTEPPKIGYCLRKGSPGA